jgi:DNA-binding beta-propeller fold protein YncE
MCFCLLIGASSLVPAAMASKPKTAPAAAWPELLLDGGRKLTHVRSLTNEREVRGKRGFWAKLTDAVIGEPDYKSMARPYGIAIDSKGRMIVSDPGMGGIHIFDAAQQKYKYIDRLDKSHDWMTEPQCVAVDAHDNIYVTDSKAGKVFIFESSGKYKGVLGSLKGDEGFFKRPTGIAIDPETQNIYVTDTLRDKVYVLDPKGQILRTMGQHGSGAGEFNYPTEIAVRNGTIAVVDALNFRVQLFDRNGNVRGVIGTPGDPAGGVYRPKGVSVDSEGHFYVVEGEWGVVQVFNDEGRLLYNFGNGTGFGQFQLPAGLFIDSHDVVYLVDSFNRRIEVFQYHAKQAVQ